MYEILTNPVTLLCLGVIFLLISVLFFYFRRSLSVLERAQMEQARILQSFITNMEMTQQMAHQRHVIGGDMNTSNNVNTANEQFIKGTSEQILIDVSDENGGDSDDSDSDDSDSGDSGDSEESDSEESDNEDNGDKIIDIMMNGTTQNIDILEPIDSSLDNLTNSSEIKVVQLHENEPLVDELNIESIHIKSLDVSSSESDDDEDDSNDDSNDDMIYDSGSIVNSSIQQQSKSIIEVKKTIESSPLEPDLKSLNVQALRQLAEDKELIMKGEKKTKKDLLTLLETTNPSNN